MRPPQVLLQDEQVPFQKLVDSEEAGVAVPYNFIREMRTVGGEVLFSASVSGSALPATPPLAARPPRPPQLLGHDVQVVDDQPEAIELPDVLW
jgi:hypothetical protein